VDSRGCLAAARIHAFSAVWRQGECMKRGLVIGLGVALFLLLILAWASVRNYNRLVTLEEGVTSQWAQVENVYQRRADLVPNLVATVKGAAEHERETFQAVTEARAKVGQLDVGDVFDDPAKMKQFQAAQGELSGALSRLLVVAEAYPQLKANENFLGLQSQLEGTENRITVERQRFNEAARDFNTTRKRFPTVIYANAFGFDEKAYFEAEAGAAKAPEVSF
jgi:LemA protein